MGERDDKEDEVAAAAAAEADGGREVRDDEGAKDGAADECDGAHDLPELAEVEPDVAVTGCGGRADEEGACVVVGGPVAAVGGGEGIFGAREDSVGDAVVPA